MQTILAVDDEQSVRESYRMILSDTYNIILADSASVGLEILESKHVDLILLDLIMPDMSGMQFLDQLALRGESIPVIVVTGTNSVGAAVEAMKHGVREFVIKPFDVSDIVNLIAKTLEDLRVYRELSLLREGGVADFDHIVGDSVALLEVLAKARQAMQVDSTVLLTGETGTGKDLLARAIHHGGARRDKSFVPLSCCAIPPNLVESELFGLIRGAFTGATDNRIGKMQIADGGTLFLDEIGEMPIDAQSKLLRVLQDGCFYPVGGNKVIEVDVRFICASNRNFKEAISEGLFREDLFYRINVFPIEMPPLRKRREDIPRLVSYFVSRHAPRVNSMVQEFSSAAMTRLCAYYWPGNVRELENTIERILVSHNQKTVIQLEDLEGIVTRGHDEPISPIDEFEGLPLQEATRKLERYLIKRALEKTNYVQSQACELLGTTRRILKYKMDQLDIKESPEQQSIDN